MALLVALAYWLIHGSVEWLWQMPGITLGAFLMLAAALSSVEARVEVIWPRLSHIFGRRARLAEVTAGEPPTPANSQTPVTSTAEAPAMSADQTPTTQTGENSPLSWGPRRSDQYLSRIQRRRRRKQRYLLKVRLLQPPGPLSHVVRFCVLVVSLALMVGLGLPYLSLELQDSAVGLAKSDGQKALDRAWAAHWLDATDPGPYLTQAAISHSAARSAANSTAPDRAGAVLDNLALALSGYEQAATVEPADWSVHYRAGVAALNLLLASRYTHSGLVELDYAALLE
ncbi:MAG: hypothetical protein H5T84_03240, partial [Thermoleophilia bacterium]|nr:hypothetical protein [Thermoleophilia bacterium]